MKILLTGIAGFIGSHTAERLLDRGDELVGLDNFDDFYPRSVKTKNLDRVRDRATMVEGDIRDPAKLDELLGGGAFDAVVHLAALAGVRPSIETPWRYQDVNVVGTARIAEAMVKYGVKRLVFASSSSVYGDNKEVPYAEHHRIDQPASPYAASKRAGELLLSTFCKIHGLTATCLRYFTVYGPRQRPEMAIHKFCRLVESGKPITVFGDGKTSRDYTYIDDIIDGTVAALDAKEGFRIYNLGGTQPVTLADLVRRIEKAVGRKAIIRYAPLQAGDVMQTWASVAAAERDLGYKPKIPIDEGLKRFISWMREQKDDS